jgi:hypothetical protein
MNRPVSQLASNLWPFQLCVGRMSNKNRHTQSNSATQKVWIFDNKKQESLYAEQFHNSKGLDLRQQAANA